jgi:glycosyltransferase involved in cell wall biosynthesis
MSPPHVDIYLPDLSGGGAERLHIQLARLFRDAGFSPRFLLNQHGGDLMNQVPEGCDVQILGASRQISALPKLVRYLREHRPDVLIANMEHMNVMAVLARIIARVDTRIIVTQHNAFSEQVKRKSLQFRMLPFLYGLVLPKADAIVAVSAGVADDLAERTTLRRETIKVIYNGVVDEGFDARAAEEPDHPWFAESRPVVVGMGRLVPQKDFATLIRAFRIVADRSDARLVILGEGPLRSELEAQTAELGLQDRVSLAGFVANPLPTVRKAQLFVMSSRFEGFGNVIAEALACGTPVVSTDCPHGPSEILAGGRFGNLVPVGAPAPLAEAILASLDASTDRQALRARGQEFSIRRCAQAYKELIAQASPPH